jgi:outer membrane protein assembly factor BamA
VQLAKAMNNKGYFRAEVDTVMKEKDRKMNLTYEITANQPYHIRRYSVDLAHAELASIARGRRQSPVREGMQFDADMLNQERQRVASAMRRRGYFYFDQEFIRFLADSSKIDGVIDVEMGLHDYVTQPEEEDKIFRKYKIARVHFHIDYEPERVPSDEHMYSSSKDGYVFT